MSGGSYDYLCWNTDDLCRRRGMVGAMAKRLEELGYRDAARATRDVLYLLDGAERAGQALADVWHAVEWLDSGDYGEESMRKAITEAGFQSWPPPVPAPDYCNICENYPCLGNHPEGEP